MPEPTKSDLSNPEDTERDVLGYVPRDSADSAQATPERPRGEGHGGLRPVPPVWGLRFRPGQKAPFLGIFTHTECYLSLDEQIDNIRLALERNPYLSGVTLRLWWMLFHPDKGRREWDKLDQLIHAAASRGKLVNLALLPGYNCPGWIHDEGAPEVAGERPGCFAPPPWDATYMRLFEDDVRAIAERYGHDRRVFMVEVMGHNFQGEEMHAPPKETLMPYGWSREVVLDNWRHWIGLYARLFPEKWISLVVSQMYPGENDLSERVAEIFVDECRGRAVLQTHQLSGRDDRLPPSGETCQRFHTLAPNCHEAVASFKFQPERQGSAQMTMYKLLRLGHPLYAQLWRRDADDPQYAKALLESYEVYHALEPGEIMARLKQKGLYVEASDWKPASEPDATNLGIRQALERARREGRKRL